MHSNIKQISTHRNTIPRPESIETHIYWCYDLHQIQPNISSHNAVADQRCVKEASISHPPVPPMIVAHHSSLKKTMVKT